MYGFYRGPATRAVTEARVVDETGVMWVTVPLGAQSQRSPNWGSSPAYPGGNTHYALDIF